MKQELIEGQLYQVYYNKEWRVFYFTRRISAHSYKYCPLYMDTLNAGAERIRQVPDQLAWKTYLHGTHRRIDERGAQIRPVTEELKQQLQELVDRRLALLAEAKATEKEILALT